MAAFGTCAISKHFFVLHSCIFSLYEGTSSHLYPPRQQDKQVSFKEGAIQSVVIEHKEGDGEGTDMLPDDACFIDFAENGGVITYTGRW